MWIERDMRRQCGCGIVGRLPIGITYVGEQYAFWSVSLQADEMQIRAIKPNFAQYFRLIPAAKNGNT